MNTATDSLETNSPKSGGGITIDSGSGSSAGGALSLGGTNAASIALGRSGITTTITGLATLAPSSAPALTINQYSTSAGATGEIRLMEGGASSTQYTGFKAPDGLSANLRCWP